MGKIVKLGTTGLYPTPVVLVSCTADGERPNMITLAWAGIVCSEPPMVSISIRPGRHSYELIKKSGEFVVNMPTEDILRQTDYCGIVSGRNVDKFAETGLTPMPAQQVSAPLVAECPVNLECRTTQIISLGTHDLFIGEVLATHIDEELAGERDRVSDFLAAKPVVYSPLTAEYASLREIIGRHGYSRR